MRPIAIALILLLAGCDRAAEEAEADYSLREAAPLATHGELCAAAEKVSDEWLKRRNKSQYSIWQVTAFNHCTKNPNDLASML